jgi:diacylglycerol kinase family enzyme
MTRPERKNLVVVLNRESGTVAKLGPEVVEEGLLEIFGALECKAKILNVVGGQVSEALHTARHGESDAVIVGGGDGTVASAATVFAGCEKPLGILPLGTFNLAARDVGMPLDWQESAKLLVSAPVAQMDLMEVGDRLYMCVVVLGFYPSLTIGQKEYHGSWLVKSIRTLWQTLRSAVTYPPLHLRLNDGLSVKSYRTRLALLANNDYEDIFGVIPKRRSLDAGYFTVYISNHHSRSQLIKACLTWIAGRWKQDSQISMFRATELEIDVRRKRRISVMMDGELGRIDLPFTVKLKPRALRVIAPRLTEDTSTDR